MTAAHQQSDRKTFGGGRNAALAKLHKAAKDCGHGDETRRDVIERVTGKRSAAQLSVAQLDQVVNHYKRELGWQERGKKRRQGGGKRRGGGLAPGEVQAKARALWLSLYHLGEVQEPGEQALDTFARRQLGYDSLRFLPAAEASAVVDALKAWCRRAGFAVGDADAHRRIQDFRVFCGRAEALAHPDKVILIRALWEKLIQEGAMYHGIHASLETYLLRRGYGTDKVDLLTDAQADDAVERLGRWYRRVVDT